MERAKADWLFLINSKENQMWILRLNDMRSSKIEILTTIGYAETKEALKNFLQSNSTTGYREEDKWWKVYKKGSILEWYNAPYDSDDMYHFVDIGSLEERIEKLVTEYNYFKNSNINLDNF
jgi:hypothetical protein